eukprot:TRINITY_DN2670_c0_g1_i1.p1 TRINITY_DN2670_c0_g1~~TRINITY_DN2670_c0_g1_i1.p1  ORF type:complete len:825 (+),score=358.99 TRINITY_DN2670_c0_g1_i1:64-2475(+)
MPDAVMTDGSFVLGAQMTHAQTIRGVCAYPALPGGVLTASYDKAARSWSAAGGAAEEQGSFLGHDGWVTSVCYSEAGFAGGETRPTVATAGWDKSVVLWNPDSLQPEWVLSGHTESVSCVAALPGGGLVSGGFDNAAIVWKEGFPAARLLGHSAPVACCVGLDNGDVVTGGAHKDNSLIRWSADGKKLLQYGPGGPGKPGHTSGVRAVTATNAAAGGAFASASNDTTAIVWGLDGAALRVLVGHSNQVYSIACLPSGELVTGSEDRTVKVWAEGQCTQTIPLPASVFSVCALGDDFVSAGTDCVARIWTRCAERAAPDEVAKALEAAVAAASAQTTGGLDPSQIEPASALEKPGTKDGEQKYVRRGAGVEVHCWKAAAGQWEKLGDVMDGPGDGGGGGGGGDGKKMYDGNMWDYVFDVDLSGDGSGFMKLPYNKGENPYAAAQRFIHKNAHQGVGQQFLDEIARFIQANADTGVPSGPQLGVSGMGMSADAPTASVSKYQQESDRLAAGGTVSGAAPDASDLPSTYTVNTKTNYEKMAEKLEQQNSQYSKEGDGVPSPEKLSALVKAASTGNYSGCSPESLVQLAHILMRWPAGQRFAALDLLKQVVATEAGVSLVISADKDGTAPTLQAVTAWLASQDGCPTKGDAQGPEVTLCGRVLGNMFGSQRGCAEFCARVGGVLDAAQRLWQSQKAPVAARLAMAEMLTNSALFLSRDCAGSEQDGATAGRLTAVLCTVLLFEDDGNAFTGIATALSLLMLGSSKVAAVSALAAREARLADTLRARPGPTPKAKQLLPLLQEALRGE